MDAGLVTSPKPSRRLQPSLSIGWLPLGEQEAIVELEGALS